jgi:hypothetical protein
VREGGGRLAQQRRADAPDARQLVAAGGAGPLAVGAVWRLPVLAMLLVPLVLALVVALAGAGPLGAGALAGAVGGLLAGPGALDELAARVIRLPEAGPAAGTGPPDGRRHRSPTSTLGRCPLDWAVRVGVDLELGQQSAAVAGADPGGLGEAGAGHGLAGGDQSGVGGAGALALAGLAPRQPATGPRRRRQGRRVPGCGRAG